MVLMYCLLLQGWRATNGCYICHRVRKTSSTAARKIFLWSQVFCECMSDPGSDAPAICHRSPATSIHRQQEEEVTMWVMTLTMIYWLFIFHELWYARIKEDVWHKVNACEWNSCTDIGHCWGRKGFDHKNHDSGYTCRKFDFLVKPQEDRLVNDKVQVMTICER